MEEGHEREDKRTFDDSTATATATTTPTTVPLTPSKRPSPGVELAVASVVPLVFLLLLLAALLLAIARVFLCLPLHRVRKLLALDPELPAPLLGRWKISSGSNPNETEQVRLIELPDGSSEEFTHEKLIGMGYGRGTRLRLWENGVGIMYENVLVGRNVGDGFGSSDEVAVVIRVGR